MDEVCGGYVLLSSKFPMSVTREGASNMAHEALGGIDFSDNPSILVFADGEAAAARARRSAELAGCRVSTACRSKVRRVVWRGQVGLDVAFVEIERDHGSDLEDLLDKLEEAAREGRHSSVISAPAALIDLIAARVYHPRVVHLCGADEAERVAALAMASARHKHRLHDVGKEQDVPRLLQLSEEVGRIADILASLSAREAPASHPKETEGKESGGVDAGAVRAFIRARRLREQYFESELFADPAWDMLLDLYAARLEKQRVAVSSLCIAAAVPATTALRWIKTLTDLGLLVRASDPQDGRRVYIELSANAAARMEGYFKAAQRISPLNF
jgi:DNA-binding MarR family transcriptional regulator